MVIIAEYDKLFRRLFSPYTVRNLVLTRLERNVEEPYVKQFVELTVFPILAFIQLKDFRLGFSCLFSF